MHFSRKDLNFQNEDNGKNAKLSKMKSLGFGGDKVNRSKHLERDPTPDVTVVCDSHDDRFLQTAQISLKRCRFPHISLKRLKLLMISLKA